MLYGRFLYVHYRIIRCVYQGFFPDLVGRISFLFKKEMRMEYIFILNSSGDGKTTLAKELYKHYKEVYIEQSMIPEFMIPGDSGNSHQ